VNIIIGAGPAGISAAYHLMKEGNENFLIIEKNNEIGGLCKSFELGGTTLDLGGHAFFTKHSYVKELLQSLTDVPFYKQPSIFIRKVSTISFSGELIWTSF